MEGTKAEYALGLVYPMENCVSFERVNVDGRFGVVWLNHLLRLKEGLRWKGLDREYPYDAYLVDWNPPGQPQSSSLEP